MSGSSLDYGQLYLGGRWEAPSGRGRIEVVSPSTEQVVGSVPAGTADDMDRAVAAARAAFDHGPWPRLAPEERRVAVERLAAAYEPRVDELAEVITTEMGSPISFSRFAQAAAAHTLITTFCELAAAHPWRESRPSIMGGETVVRRAPVGVVAAIVPWNVPQIVTVAKLVPALLAGCTVVVKPSPETPLDAMVLAEVLTTAGLPEGVVSIVPAGPEAGEHLARHPGVDKVAFTGSTAVGRRLGAICGEQLKRCSLELGGKSAAVVLDDADVARTAAGLRFASFLNGGQACAAQTRVLAPRSLYADLVDALAATADDLCVGDPTDPDTEVGPLVSRRQRDRVRGYIDAGMDGARLVTGGSQPPVGQGRGWFVRPTVFADVDNGSTIAREEIFGPVVVVTPYDGIDHAVDLANDSPYGLAGSVWTKDRDAGVAVAERIRTGSLGVNHYGQDLRSPFGGFKASGIGREFGPEGLDAYTELQSIGLLPKR